MPRTRSSRTARRLLAATVALALGAGLVAGVPGSAQAAEELYIGQIQGTGATSPELGRVVTTKPSVVTAVYGQTSTDFRGFVIQTPGSGGRYKNLGAPSDAIFVFMGNTPFQLKIGDAVQVTGTVGEFKSNREDVQTQTQLAGSVTVTELDQQLRAPLPVTGWRWSSTAAGRENLESMLYYSPESFLVADPYNLRQFGEVALSADQPAVQPTEVAPYGSRQANWQARRNAATRVNLDDGTNRNNTVAPGRTARQIPFLTPDRDVTVGDRMQLDEPVIIDWRNNAWKFNPTRVADAGDEPATLTSQIRADRTPTVGGAFSVASFNVLNYFTTLGAALGCGGSQPDTEGSPNLAGTCAARGAYDAADLGRQQTKIVTAINRLDASVTGLMEIENSAALGEEPDEALQTLVTALNRAAGYAKWQAVASSDQLQPVADQDVITNAFIFQPAQVRLNGPAWALGSAAGATGPFANARTPLAAAFRPVGGGESMIVVVNHFKSKGSTGATGENIDKGQGAYNADRTRQAEAVRNWLPTLQAAAGTDQVAVIGDLNAYSQEDPVRVFYRAGFVSAAPADQYSYVFSGLSGSLDHILLNPAARSRMTRSDVWNINSVESDALEYSSYRTTALDYYTGDVRRASDHDPVIAGFRRGPR